MKFITLTCFRTDPKTKTCFEEKISLNLEHYRLTMIADEQPSFEDIRCGAPTQITGVTVVYPADSPAPQRNQITLRCKETSAEVLTMIETAEKEAGLAAPRGSRVGFWWPYSGDRMTLMPIKGAAP